MFYFFFIKLMEYCIVYYRHRVWFRKNRMLSSVDDILKMDFVVALTDADSFNASYLRKLIYSAMLVESTILNIILM